MNISGDLQPLPQNTERVQTADRASSAHSATQSSPAPSAVSKAAAGPPALSVDQTHLSTAASLVSRALGANLSANNVELGDVRLDKVAAVQSALASGSYQVSSSQVAGKLIDHMLEGGK
jgi:negative regulator of flagellin synthesis FlgM